MDAVLLKSGIHDLKYDRNKFEKILKGGIAAAGAQPNAIRLDRGRYYVDQNEMVVLKKLGDFVGVVLCRADKAVLPEYSGELVALGKMLSQHGRGEVGSLHFICPVCPDYGVGGEFYQQLRTGISPEAMGAINFVGILPTLKEMGIVATASILVADTEDDVSEIINRTVKGNTLLYSANCHKSVEKITEKVAGLPVKVTSFFDYFGDSFRRQQYLYDELLRSVQKTNTRVRAQITQTGASRVERHSQILGRREEDFELTIRYMAQYMALGAIVKREDRSKNTILANYPTPNRKFFNSYTNVDPELSLGQLDQTTIPVMGTQVRR